MAVANTADNSSYVIAAVMTTCVSCESDYFRIIGKFLEKNDEAIEFLKDHGALPMEVRCPRCNKLCCYSENRNLWQCTGSYLIPKTKKRRYCGYSVSNYKGSFLSNSKVDPWKIILFVNHFLSRHWDVGTVEDCLHLAKATIVKWHSFCNEVTESWFSSQEPIGGHQVEVEIDETLIGCRKYKKDPVLSRVWLFGGIERVSKKRFVVPLTGEFMKERDTATLIPIIQKYVLHGSIIYHNKWKAYDSLHELGYTHHFVNNSENFIHFTNPSIHTQTIGRLWRDVKEWMKQPGIRSDFLCQYLSRYLFIIAHKKESLLHHFFVEAGKLYPPLSEKVHSTAVHPKTESSDEEYVLSAITDLSHSLYLVMKDES